MSESFGVYKRWIFLATSVVMVVTLGCSRSEERAAPEAAASSGDGGSNPGIDLNCVVDWLQNPVAPFHYSYKTSGDNVVEESADVTPQTIDGSFKNNSVSREVHGVRSDSDSWQAAWSSLMGISGMSSTIALVNPSSAMVREGTDRVNGYDTVRYSIDTSRADSAEAGLYRSTLGEGGFEKGTVWVTDKGCPIRISLDSESHSGDGTVDKVHYDEEIVKK